MTRNVIQSLWRELSVRLRRASASGQGTSALLVEPEWARVEQQTDHETLQKKSAAHVPAVPWSPPNHAMPRAKGRQRCIRPSAPVGPGSRPAALPGQCTWQRRDAGPASIGRGSGAQPVPLGGCPSARVIYFTRNMRCALRHSAAGEPRVRQACGQRPRLQAADSGGPATLRTGR